jgi:Subtilase family
VGICGIRGRDSRGISGGIHTGESATVRGRRAAGWCMCLALVFGLLPSALTAEASGGARLGGIPIARPAICSSNGAADTCVARAAVARKKSAKKSAKCTGAHKKSKSCLAAARKAAKKKIAKKKAAAKKKLKSSTSAAPKSTPDGLGPAQIRGAYNLPSAAPIAQTIAIVTAFDDPNAESDLGVYSSNYSLPSCTSANGCFRKVNGLGQARPLPPANATWALETSLDVQIAHGVCPNCKILLVEAPSASILDLLDAVDSAVSLGANEVSNSWVVDEFSAETSFDSRLNHPGVAITAASGDTGSRVQWPASSPYVTAVGGTTLTVHDDARVSESAWQSGGSGCSRYESKPAWQTHDGCAGRMVPDVAAVGDPSSGAAVYDSYGYSGSRGWFKIGGTSLAAPIVAAIYALAGNADQVVAGSYPYAHSDSLFDVRSGASGSCSPSYLCSTGIGYDGPTGVGSPNGTGGF